MSSSLRNHPHCIAFAILVTSIALPSCRGQKENLPSLPKYRTSNEALLEYAARGDAEGTGRSLDAGADPNHNPSMSPPSRSGFLGRPDTPLINAARGGHVRVVRLLLARGALPNVRTLDETPLHAAAKRGHTDIVSLLLEAGASVNARVGLGGHEDAMTAAKAYRHADTVSLLYLGGAPIEPRDLCDAVEVADADLVATYLNIIDSRRIDCHGLSVLDRARRLSPSAERDKIVRSLSVAMRQSMPQ
jgi:hypothetical protein